MIVAFPGNRHITFFCWPLLLRCICCVPSRPLLMCLNVGFRYRRQLRLLRGYLLLADTFSFKHFGFSSAEEVRDRNVRLSSQNTKVLDIFNTRLYFSK